MLVANGGAPGNFWERDDGPARRASSFAGYLPAEELERWLAFFRDVESVEIPNAGHMVHFDEPKRLNDAIDAFVARRGIG